MWRRSKLKLNCISCFETPGGVENEFFLLVVTHFGYSSEIIVVVIGGGSQIGKVAKTAQVLQYIHTLIPGPR